MKRRKATTIVIFGVTAGALALFSYALEGFSLCIYNGKLYAKTTLEQEFRDARFVVRGQVVSSEDLHDPYEGVVYQVRVKQTFKGKPAAVLIDYPERDSGGFYLDVGTEFLLFLDPIGPDDDPVTYLGQNWKTRLPGATMVNYNCGQSRPWSEVPHKDRELLNALSKQPDKKSN